jgi:hypothetical protein
MAQRVQNVSTSIPDYKKLVDFSSATSLQISNQAIQQQVCKLLHLCRSLDFVSDCCSESTK